MRNSNKCSICGDRLQEGDEVIVLHFEDDKETVICPDCIIGLSEIIEDYWETQEPNQATIH